MGGLFGLLTSGVNAENVWFEILALLFSAAIVIFLTMPVHEWAHGFAASKLGDPTARYYGRLKLNPLAHIDPMGALCILAFGIGWAKPVPVDARYFKNPKRDMAITAFAGPLSNLILALISLLLSNMFYAVYFFVPSRPVLYYIFYFLVIVFANIAAINIGLAIFNLVPIPPLDGSKILAAFLSDKAYYSLMRYERYFSMILFALIMFSTRFSNILSAAINGVYNAFDWLTWLPFEAILKAIIY